MKWLTLLFVTCCAINLSAQDNPVVYSVDGPVRYSPASKGWFNFSPLKTGMPLSKEGRLKLRAGTSVSVLYDEQFATINTRGKHDIAAFDLISNLLTFVAKNCVGFFVNCNVD